MRVKDYEVLKKELETGAKAVMKKKPISIRLSEKDLMLLKRKDMRVKKVLTSGGEEKEVWFVHVREGKFGKEREALIYFFGFEWKTLWERWFSQLKPDDYIFTYTIKYPKSTKTLILKQDTVKRFFREEVNAHRKNGTVYIPYWKLRP